MIHIRSIILQKEIILRRSNHYCVDLLTVSDGWYDAYFNG
jgi:hypothetical protein